jgi:hypothetical protein
MRLSTIDRLFRTMCTISDKLKFCTCSADEINTATESYWQLYRFNPTAGRFIVGAAHRPSLWLDPNFKLNSQTVLNRLNEPDAFDKELHFERKDRLTVVIWLKKEDEEPVTYTYKHTGRVWKEAEEDPYTLREQYDTEAEGCLEYALKD